MEMKLSATSAASSLALLRFLPSYQNLAWWIAPLTVTRLDQAVRPPISFSISVSKNDSILLLPFIFPRSHSTPFALPWGRVAAGLFAAASWTPSGSPDGRTFCSWAPAYLFCLRRFGMRARRSGTRGMRL